MRAVPARPRRPAHVTIDVSDKAAFAELLGGTPEADLQRDVLALAKLLGWRCYHPLPSIDRRGRWRTHLAGDPGWPDLALARRGRLILAELKKEKERLETDQALWFAELHPVAARSGGTVTLAVWRPSDWRSGAIEAELRVPAPLFEEAGG